MILRYVDKRREALAEPHCNISVHVDSKRLKALLEATHGIKLEGTGIHPEIHAADLRQSQTANGHEACRMETVLLQLTGPSQEASGDPTVQSQYEGWDTSLCLPPWHILSTT